MIWEKINNSNYSVSSTGLIRNDNTSRIIKNTIHHTGYYIVSITINGEYKQRRVNRLVALHHLPNPKNLPVVNHKDTIKTNNRVENLEWCTKEHNETHAKENGLKNSSKGESNGTSLLRDKDIINIRSLAKQGKRQSEIATLYNVSRACICNIVNNKTWKHL